MSPPSAGTSYTFCCCTRYLKGKKTKESIEIRVNGQRQLKVATNGIKAVSNNQLQLPTISAQVTEPEEHYETARTSRNVEQSDLMSMSELIRMVRIEEGLEVTPRVDNKSQPPEEQRQQVATNKCKRRATTSGDDDETPKVKRMHRAVFNEDGDITSRTISSRTANVEYTIYRKSSTSSSIEMPALHLNEPPIRQSLVVRRLSTAPQFIVTVIAVTYAFITSIFTTISNLLFVSK